MMDVSRCLFKYLIHGFRCVRLEKWFIPCCTMSLRAKSDSGLMYIKVAHKCDETFPWNVVIESRSRIPIAKSVPSQALFHCSSWEQYSFLSKSAPTTTRCWPTPSINIEMGACFGKPSANDSFGLPNELLAEVLSGLSVKETLHCRLVCKQWNALIIAHPEQVMRIARLKFRIVRSIGVNLRWGAGCPTILEWILVMILVLHSIH